MDVANLISGVLSLVVTVAIGVIAYRLQRSQERREQRDDRREFVNSVEEWAHAAEEELLGRVPPVSALYLREALESDRQPVEKMRPEFLIRHVERALERIGTVPPAQRPPFVESVRVMRLWNERRWVVDPKTTIENEAHWATGTLRANVSLTGSATVEQYPRLHREGTLGIGR